MVFLYEYRTKDNILKRGAIDAADRDAAFAALKSQGIKPSRVTEAPGLFNKLFGKGKRWIVIGVLGVLCLVLGVVVKTVGDDLKASREEVDTVEADLEAAREEAEEAKAIAFTFEDMTRRQVIGDVAIIEKGIATGWEEVFPYEGERFLASFAIPGVPAGLRNTTEDEIKAALGRTMVESIGGQAGTRDATGSSLGGLSLEHRQIVYIVEGMKNELRRYLANNKHTIVEYGKRLVARQEQEIAYYQRAKTEIETAFNNKIPAPNSSPSGKTATRSCGESA